MSDPRQLWQPAFGQIGLRPCDMADLTPEQLEQAVEFLQGPDKAPKGMG